MTFRWTHQTVTPDSEGRFTVAVGTNAHSGEEIKGYGGFVDSGNSTSTSENVGDADSDVTLLGSSSYFESSNEIEYVIMSFRADGANVVYRAHIWIKI